MNNRPCEVEDCPLVTPFRTILPRPASYALRLLGGFSVILLALLVSQHHAAAQGRLDARYEATLAGIFVGQGSWTLDVPDDQFCGAAHGRRSRWHRGASEDVLGGLRHQRLAGPYRQWRTGCQ